MNVKAIGSLAAQELARTIENMNEKQIDELMKAICNANKIFICGAGRSQLMLRGIAMRLMHLGFDSYVVGDTTTPALQEGDLLILGSGSGETSGLVNVASKAKNFGGKIAVITIKAESTLGKMADFLVQIPAYTDKIEYNDMKKPVLPGGSLFEQAMLVLGDALVIPLGEIANIPTNKAFARHANLE